jgi:crotonobetainyl-CoA:carnitine CoA-transferase CaiB-like acyl-CoA transferase
MSWPVRPFCTYQLALLGASVPRIEPPEASDPIRTHGGDAELNRPGKPQG